MSTQGMVTMLCGGKVVAKIIAGSDGMKAKNVAQSIVKHLTSRGIIDIHLTSRGIIDIEMLNMIADNHGFDDRECRITVARNLLNPDAPLLGMVDDGDTVLAHRINRTFDMPTFNPRWDHGTADHCYIVDMDHGNIRKADYDTPQDAVHPPNAGVYDGDIVRMTNLDLLKMMNEVVQRNLGNPSDTALWDKLLAELRDHRL